MTQVYYRDQALEAIARRVVKTHDAALLSSPRAIPIEEIIGTCGLEIDYQYIRNNGRILGETIFDDTLIPVYDKDNGQYSFISVRRGSIIIDASLLQPAKIGRLRFTMAHELAHWLIHQEIYTGTGESAAMLNKPLKSSEADAGLERQADRLACFLLMPTGQVKTAFYHNRNHADLTAAIANLFGVSRQAMDIRLKELRLV
ncbi:MAG: ImmA/IrrE family metallo-endopeptidase [Clostridiales bacterium]|jgi:Zn-dependent peptidase ImmA (M78 family)|nr:ImmA/IrrE family metallo-endopeptidase [Clostridiales bacterium]